VFTRGRASLVDGVLTLPPAVKATVGFMLTDDTVKHVRIQVLDAETDAILYTIVGERGSSLSGGQRQRVAIARALITDPRILIFDEATSALDYESERVIQGNMSRIANGRTVFIIAHRLSTLRVADRVITIERGRLIEDGTHDELIKTGGRYAALWRLQAGVHEVH
jgi:ABC-type multidrug transport system fused ATPase/permease subunit